MKYNSSNKIEDSQWDELKNSIEKLYTSWTTIENDLNLKDNIQKDNITNLNKNFDNLLLYAINKDEKNLISEFMNELLDQELRDIVSNETKKIREDIEKTIKELLENDVKPGSEEALML